MPMIVKKSLLLAKAETTYDTDPTPTAASNALAVQDAQIKENAGVIERNVQITTLGGFASILGEQWAEISFKVPVIGSGTAGTAPRVGALLKACGCSETVVSNTSVTYAPISASIGSVTLYLYKDGRLHIMTGCRGSVKLVYSAGKELMMEFNFMGRYAAPTLVALPTPTFESTVTAPPVCKSTTFQYNSKSTLVVGSLELDLGINTVKRTSLNDANAIAGFEITDRKPKVTIDPEATIETSYAFRSDRLTTTRALSIVATRAAGNIVTLSIPRFNITKVEYGDRDGILVEKLEGEAVESTSLNDSFSLAFT